MYMELFVYMVLIYVKMITNHETHLKLNERRSVNKYKPTA